MLIWNKLQLKMCQLPTTCNLKLFREYWQWTDSNSLLCVFVCVPVLITYNSCLKIGIMFLKLSNLHRKSSLIMRKLTEKKSVWDCITITKRMSIHFGFLSSCLPTYSTRGKQNNLVNSLLSYRIIELFRLEKTFKIKPVNAALPSHSPLIMSSSATSTLDIFLKMADLIFMI